MTITFSRQSSVVSRQSCATEFAVSLPKIQYAENGAHVLTSEVYDVVVRRSVRTSDGNSIPCRITGASVTQARQTVVVLLFIRHVYLNSRGNIRPRFRTRLGARTHTHTVTPPLGYMTARHPPTHVAGYL